MTPKLPSFEKLHPDISISINTEVNRLDPSTKEEFDLAISWGRGNWRQHIFEPLFTSKVFPVCSPEFFETFASKLGDLTGYR
tara:strand:- start:834 stop:1079 length:246 start_codon:yes stop_codon:yes gene_type:complete